MKPTLTKKMLIDWAGTHVVRDAESLVKRGDVLEATYDPPHIRGAILRSNRPIQTGLKILDDGSVENLCPCYDNRERGIVCVHAIAVGLTLVERAADPLRERKYQEELRRASRLAEFDDSDYLRRVPAAAPGALPTTLVLSLPQDWTSTCRCGCIPLYCRAVYRQTSVPLDEIPRELPLSFSKRDESLLFVLEDISEGPAKGRLDLTRADFMNLLRLLTGRPLPVHGEEPVRVNEAKLTTYLHMDLDRENGELILIAHTELPFMAPGEFPLYIVSGNTGWAYGAGNLWPLENVLPTPYHPIYDEPVILPRPDVLRFLQHELPALAQHARIESDITLDLFTVVPDTPHFHLVVRGSPASLSATLYASYGDLELVAAKPDAKEHFATPDPSDLLGYRVRNREAEEQALLQLRASGFAGECGDDLTPIVGGREVLNFLGTHYPALRRQGWQVDMQGRVGPYLEDMEYVTPVVTVTDTEGTDWFDVGFTFESGGAQSLSPADVQLAIRKGDSFIKRGDKTILVDTDAVESLMGVFTDCPARDGVAAGHFRMANLYAGFVKASLDSLDGVDVEDTPKWRGQAAKANRTMKIEKFDLPPSLENQLRSYQKDGVYWLRFLETNGFSGLLADEMGLGKTVQTLAWLQTPRHETAARGKPALIVCPTSLVENWAEESAKFTPDLKVITLTGSDRHERWASLPDADLAITSYALLRRDLDRYLEHDFSAAILDEAQHIKNRSTQNAVAAKKIKAHHRLVLTGTPVENSVSDLWSIMDFLMPGYLGSHDGFKGNYEQPLARGGQDAERAQVKLRRKLQPFLLRRLKSNVAKDLPPKISKVFQCTLTSDQKTVYVELLEASRRKISNMVAQKGFNKCRMEILTTLLRLRQVCCHLDLLKLPDLKSEHPSAKMDYFFELLDEALDSGHRVLVFSQFVSMLHILRDELKARDLDFCYLDGSTKDRMKEVHRFNSERSIPLFLISLKAGGTGLNLTGADMVVHFDPWWNPAVENQATDRAYRIGQKRTVYNIKLITRDTVEEKVLALQERKQAVIDATVESDEQVVQSLTWTDVQDLLAL